MTSREVARFVLVLLLDTTDWVFRRVESVRFIDDQLLHRRMSMDFRLPADFLDEVPGTADGVLVPLALLKKQPLTRLDLVDETGRAIPVLTKEQNSEVAVQALLALAEEIIAPDPVSKEFRQLLQLIVSSPHSTKLWDQLMQLARDAPAAAAILDNSHFRDLAEALSENFLLLAVLQNHVRQRRILKYSYVQELDWERVEEPLASQEIASQARQHVRFWSSQFPIWIGWLSNPFDFSLPEIGLGGSYHFEVEAPRGLQVAYASITTETADGALQEKVDPVAISHLYAEAQEQGAKGSVHFLIRPRVQGLVRASLATSAATTILLVSGALFPEVLIRIGDLTVTLLLTLIGLISAFIARPGENSLATRLLFGIRLLVAVSGSLAYLAALTAAVGRVELWTQLGGLSGLVTGTLIVSHLNARVVTQPR